ncbi:hypothetical protein [Burkholderia sp. Bp8991]|uniref:hypothetical protein n=1 Tax=Burkholderia sp. Bp8991 TaxID=2184553 RepID=UPI000F5A4823|nr:hypothetical protein [Burkholderia sp. Bp8991]
MVALQSAELAEGTLPMVNSAETMQMEDTAAAPQGAFEVSLGRTYRDEGFFNGGVASDLLLGAGGERIEIFFGDEREPIRGTINRTSNLNKTPRVFGGRELQQRFQSLPESTPMVVEVLSPTSIRIRVVQPAG